jgi:acyl-CoA oxidase
MWIHGKCYGVKNFVVQLRDPKTFEPLPGISIGDCGAKMGRNGIDNGWIQFTHVRIPRSHLLMKYTKVTREGTVTEPPMAQLTYGALIQGRVSMIKESADIAKKALMIAARYSCIRRQFSAGTDMQEIKIMDYQTHQNRLFPVLVSAFAMHFSAVETYRIFDELISKLEVAKAGDASMQEAIESLKETHATSAGLKAYCTWFAGEAIEICRQCCGGHGYSSYAGLASMFQDYVVQCTWEGDNTVLTLQAGRYLIGCYRDMRKGKTLPKGVNYLNGTAKALSAVELVSLEAISLGFDYVRCQMICSLGSKFEELISVKGMSEEAAYDECCKNSSL